MEKFNGKKCQTCIGCELMNTRGFKGKTDCKFYISRFNELSSNMTTQEIYDNFGEHIPRID
ncbi:MAG: hypothetical protein IJ629_06160 [Clostridia bacterium]|nr:hypothetical protein [Clostridia bacterium]